jgi:hypothetical protein
MKDRLNTLVKFYATVADVKDDSGRHAIDRAIPKYERLWSLYSQVVDTFAKM